MVMLYLLTKFALKGVEEYVIDNDKKQKRLERKVNGLDHALYNLNRYVTRSDSESSDSESSIDSESSSESENDGNWSLNIKIGEK